MDPPSTDLQIVHVGFHDTSANSKDFLPDRCRGSHDGPTAKDGAAASEGTCPVGALTGITFDDGHVIELEAKLFGRDLGETSQMALTLSRLTHVDQGATIRRDLHPGTVKSGDAPNAADAVAGRTLASVLDNATDPDAP
jgi:hypothetical protein